MRTGATAVVVAGSLVLLCAPEMARAQDSIPPFVAISGLPKPGPGRIAGVVLDTAGRPVDSAEVSIAEAQRRTLTDAYGRFAFDGLKRGTYEVRARHAGYGPQVRRFAVGDSGGVGLFQLVPRGTMLPVVIATATRGGLEGVVGDTSYRALAGATVTVMGTRNRSAATDSVGHFFIGLLEGQYMLKVSDTGFKPRLLSVDIPRGSGQHVSILLAPGHPAPGQAEAEDQLLQRLTLRSSARSRFISRSDAQKLGMDWLTEVIQMGVTQLGCSNGTAPRMVIRDGLYEEPSYEITVDQIESVEIYRNTSATGVIGASSPIMDQPQVSPVVPVTGRGGRGTPSGANYVMPGIYKSTPAGACSAVVYVWMRK